VPYIYWVTLVLRFLGLGYVLLGLWLGNQWLAEQPDSNKFWKPLNPDSPIGWFTKTKVMALQNNPEQCHAFLQRAGVDFTPLSDRQAGQCQLHEQTLLKQSNYRYSATVKGTCPLIAALVLWEKQVVAPAAETHLASPIRSIAHYGIFACRNVRGSGRRSQHATANAIDIAAFTTESGQTIRITRDWEADTQNGAFLHQIHRQSCALFRGALGPDYNAAHHDHFHFDLGRFSFCR
tara:strand:- start:311 stop:1015 length:705 start_codon:yes stop_codon:yes gene_type:complete